MPTPDISIPKVDASLGGSPDANLIRQTVAKATPPPPMGGDFSSLPDPVKTTGRQTATPPEPAQPFPDAKPPLSPGASSVDDGQPPWASKDRQPAPTPEGIADDLAKLAGELDERRGINRQPEAEVEATADPATTTPPTPPSEEVVKVETDAEIDAAIASIKGPKELKQAFGRTKKELNAVRQEVAAAKAEKVALETKLKDIEEGRLEVPNPKVEALQKERDEALERVRLLDYKQHPEYTDKFIKPYQQTLEGVYKSLKQLKVLEEDGTARAATQEDFNEIARLPLGDAAELATKKFGSTVGPLIINKKIRLDEIKEQADEAVANAGEASKQFAAQQQEQQAKAVAQQKEFVRKLKTEELTGKFKELFGEREGDTEGNASLNRELSRFGVLFEAPETVAPEARTQTAVQMLVRAANLPRYIARTQALETELSELKAKLAEFSKSEPKGGTRTTPATGKVEYADPMQKAQQGIAEWANKRR